MLKCCSEGVLFRGALANGISLGILYSFSVPIYDYLKEWIYWFLGPASYLRPTALLTTTSIACALAIPFDNIKTRLHVMTKLPDGRLPYLSIRDAFSKIFTYECNVEKYSSVFAFQTGYTPYLLRTYITMLMGIYISDKAFRQNYQETEHLETGEYSKLPFVKDFPHNPINRYETLKECVSVTPKKKYFTDKSKTSSFEL